MGARREENPLQVKPPELEYTNLESVETDEPFEGICQGGSEGSFFKRAVVA